MTDRRTDGRTGRQIDKKLCRQEFLSGWVMLCIQSPPKRELYNQNPEKVIISKLAALDYMWDKKPKPTSTLHHLFAGSPPPPPNKKNTQR